MLELIKGSIFNSKCDLIIIPCNNFGSVTWTMQKELMVNDLPYYRREIPTGDVCFIRNTGTYPNASMIGYAASVNAYGGTTTEEIIESILQKIKSCCQNESFQKVNIPLLGTGAGGLSAYKSFEVMKKVFKTDSDISLCVYAFSEDIYTELSSKSSWAQNNSIKNPRVFISYTGFDLKNREWVRDFACKLRNCGINARLDMFHLKPGQDLPQWMTNELLMADKVLLICDKYYAEKADNRKGGVGWETMIIQGDMLSRQEQNKYIVILRDTDIDHSLPIYVKSRYALNWADEGQVDKEFNELLLYLFDCDIEPPIGEIPAFVKDNLKKKSLHPT